MALGWPWASARSQPSRPAPQAGARIWVTVAGVASDGSSRVLRDAEVRLKSTRGTTEVDSVQLSDDDGRVIFDGLPAGYYLIEAGSTGYVRTQYGARRHDVPGVPVALSAGQSTDVRLALPRGGALSGTVLDPAGQPAYAVSVTLLESRTVAGVRMFVEATRAHAAGAVTSVSTDSRGRYRFYGLPRGEYIIRATTRNLAADGPVWARPSAIGYFPGVGALDAAVPVQVDVGGEATGLDVGLHAVRFVDVAGSVGPLPTTLKDGIRIALLRDGITADVVTAEAGRFRFAGVAPGLYSVKARSVPSGLPFAREDSGPALWGTTDLLVGSENVTDISVALNPSMTFSGRVGFESAQAVLPPGLRPDVEVMLVPVEAVTSTSHLLRVTQRAGAAGEFMLPGVTPGRYFIEARVAPHAGMAPYRLMSAVIDGQDVLGVPVEFAPNRSLADAVLTFTDTTQELSGVLQDQNGRHPLGYQVVIFPVDQRYWTRPSARVRATVAATDGSFRFADLLPGEYWLAATAESGPDVVLDPAFLQRLARSSVAIRLDRGTTLTHDLAIRVEGGDEHPATDPVLSVHGPRVDAADQGWSHRGDRSDVRPCVVGGIA